MASAATVQALVNYYQSLLIIQYNAQPLASAEIGMVATQFSANGVALDVQNAYNLTGNNTAVGAQLDVLGKYAGVDRFYSQLILSNYSAMVPYVSVGSLPTSPPEFGLVTYSNYASPSYNGTLYYGEIVAINNQLNDASFLQLILLAIANNNSNASDYSIDATLYKYFGLALRAEDPGSMFMVFFASTSLTTLVQAVLAKKLLPKPIAVGGLLVSNVNSTMFAFYCYGTAQSPFGAGFSTYSNYATLAGQFLAYQQITGV